MSNLPHVRDCVFGQPWAIHEPALKAIADIVENHITGTANPAASGLKNESAKKEVTMVGNMAVVPIHGTIMQRASLFTEISGATTYGAILRNLQTAMDGPAKIVLLDVDSTGGEAFGCEAAADAIYAMRGRKLMLAFTDRFMASGAYWLAAQADLVFSTPDAEVGSIGVLAKVPDTSRMEKNLGVDHRVVRSGPNKAIGHGPVTEEQLQQVREQVEQIANSFWASVSRARGIELTSEIKSGRTWTGQNAVTQGLVDETMTFPELVKRYG